MTARRTSLAAVAIALAVIAALLAARAALAIDPLDHLAATDGERRGFVYLPRGGPYRFALETPGPGRAFVGDLQIATNPLQPTRVVLQPGTATIRVSAPPGARLLWHPPGRVSHQTLEYLPASALAATPDFDRWAGASPLDAALATALALTLVALLLFLARDRLRAAGRPVVLATLAVFAVAAAVRLVDIGAAGQTWDEDVNWSAGRNYAENVVALDGAPRSWIWNYEHPPVSKYLAGIGALWADGYDPARAVMGLVVALGCALLVPIGARLFSLRVGVVAATVAALTPHLVAHGKVVGHEAPTVLVWSLALLLALGAHDGTPSPRRLAGRLAVIGAVLGLAVATRFVNALVAIPIAVTLLAYAPPVTRRRTIALGAAIIPLVALATLVAIWPRLWSSPITHMAEAWARLRSPHSPEPFLGVITNTPPLHYFLVYLAATAPVGLLALALAGIARVLRLADRRTLVIAAWLLAPLVVMASPVRQDGVRYVMPCLTALALLAAVGLDTIATFLTARLPTMTRALPTTLAAITALYLAVTLVRVHPYYLDYYGEHVGGPAAVARARRFEVAWWGEGLADAVDHVNRHARPGAPVFRDCVEPAHLTWFRGDLWPTMAKNPRDAEWIVAYQPAWKPCPIPPDARLVHTVAVMDAPLVRVYQRDPLAPPAAAVQPAPP
jgi:4-amino-4-deoxy-L-arabinose transferase-like glycosyltransferase